MHTVCCDCCCHSSAAAGYIYVFLYFLVACALSLCIFVDFDCLPTYYYCWGRATIVAHLSFHFISFSFVFPACRWPLFTQQRVEPRRSRQKLPLLLLVVVVIAV